ncbi:hypothetical protein QQ008_23720 [Fulvivirgaceae bacterium BMA10]|uniref:Lipoprotein n=1 Tax=Splendidivirga corallicola TaxID=3051826 RepID=A0ABT8KWU1_9BACT|nr:hypothetical protein [Fulvivirgaceae bacterium BMA10]
MLVLLENLSVEHATINTHNYKLMRQYHLCILVGLLFLVAFSGCNSGQQQNHKEETVSDAIEISDDNPAMDGFNEVASDSKAIEIADEVMQAMGGRNNWDATRFIVWEFFGRRKLYWDKWTGNVRVESLTDDFKVLLNVHEMTGKVFRDSSEITQPDSLAKYVQIGKNIWINDSYWLVMPFKLKDSGVTLKYTREDTTQVGALSDVLTLTFEEVGVTPQNKYEVFVDKNSRLITQWSFFSNANDDSARFVTPWADYNKYGSIMLSGNRGRGSLNGITVLDSMPESVFSSFEAVDMNSLKRL